jgi:hypothetical protein
MQSACVVLSSVSCLAVQYFFLHCLIKGAIKKIVENLCFDFALQLLSEKFLILRRIHQNVVILVDRSSCKVPIILVRFK